MRILIILFFVSFGMFLASSCSMSGNAVMDGIKEGMTRDQVNGVMRSRGLKAEDSRRRPSGGWKTYGQDPFAAGVSAAAFESETGHHVEWAELYYQAGSRSASVINLYYDANGQLVR